MDPEQGGPTRILGIRIRNTEGNKRFRIQGTDAIIGYLWYMHKIYIVKGGFRNDFSKLQVAQATYLAILKTTNGVDNCFTGF
jgi:hypothetical protein